MHEQFLYACLQECLLGSQDLLNILMKIMATCLVFADHVKSFIADSTAGDLDALPVREGGSKDTKKEKEIATSKSTKTKSRVSGGGKAGRLSEDGLNATTDRVKEEKPLSLRKINNNLQTEYILRESAHSSFVRNLVMFEQKFDKMVRGSIACTLRVPCV